MDNVAESNNKMNLEVKVELVADLRSGLHKQGKTLLNSSQGWCCLGRLTDLYLKKFGKTWEVSTQLIQELQPMQACSYKGLASTLSLDVQKWSGMKSELGSDILVTQDLIAKYCVDGLRVKGDKSYTSLASLNDSGVPFSVLADLIEEQL